VCYISFNDPDPLHLSKEEMLKIKMTDAYGTYLVDTQGDWGYRTDQDLVAHLLNQRSALKSLGRWLLKRVRDLELQLAEAKAKK